MNNYDTNGQWGFGDVFNAAKSIIKSVAQAVTTAVVATVNTAVKVITTVAATVNYIGNNVIAPAIRTAAKVVGSIVSDTARAVSNFVVQQGNAISFGASVGAIGMCFASVYCGIATAAATAVGAGIAAAQSYSEHKDWRRATAQAVGSAFVSLLSFGSGKYFARLLGAGEIGEIAIDLNGSPLEFLGGMGVSNAIDSFCDSTNGSMC